MPKTYSSNTEQCPNPKRDIRPNILTANTHPTVKPLKLIKYLIKLVCPKNGIILDPFIGSGTTGIGAKELGRKFIGFEKEQEYVNIANKRLNEQW